MKIVLLSTADYETPLWTNKQYIAVQLSARYDVLYFDSMGLRRPTFSRNDLNRSLARLWPRTKSVEPQELRAVSPRPKNLTVIGPRVIPWHGNATIRRVNRWSLRRQLHQALGDAPFVLWTYTPLTYGLDAEAAATIYHCVDLLHTFPGIDRDLIIHTEKQLAEQNVIAVASSSGVLDHLNSQGFVDIRLWENVADVDLILDATPAGPRKEQAIFAGNLTTSKVDFSLLLRVADSMPLKIAGPHAIDGTNDSESLRSLLQHPNVSNLGVLSPRDLASQLYTCSVGLVPYLTNHHTEGVFPLKVYEYMAAGLAVVCTPLNSLTGQRPHITLSKPDRFAGVALEMRHITPESILERRLEAQRHSWKLRGEQARGLVEEVSP